MLRRVVVLGGGLAVLIGLAWGSGVEGQIAPTAPSKASATAEPLVENLVRFDPRDLRLTWNSRHWQLVQRGTVLKDFGFREQDARQALRLLLDLKINEYGTIGTPAPVMEYWLSDGKAPQALGQGGLRVLSLDRAHLRVEQVNGQWCVGDGSRVLYTFGTRRDDARQALAVMRKYHFAQAAVVGQAGPSMVVFLSRPEGDLPTPFVPQRSSGGRQINVQRFSRLAKNADGSPRREVGSKPGSPYAGVVVPALPAVNPPTALAKSPQPGWRVKPTVAGHTAALVDPSAERVPFDWRQVQLRQGPGGEWKLAAGSMVLADFGPNINEARLALSALRYYRFREQWRVGGPQPAVTYYVADRAAPRGLMLGLSGQPFQPDKLEVRQVEGRYSLCNGPQVVLRLGGRSDEAARALDKIQSSHADRLCQVGEPGKQPMTFLVRSR